MKKFTWILPAAALALSAVLFSGQGFSATASETVSGGDVSGNEGGTGAGEQKPGEVVTGKLSTPVNLSWGENYIPTWLMSDLTADEYRLEVEKDGKDIVFNSTWGTRPEPDGSTKLSGYSRYMNESGSYRFRVTALADRDDAAQSNSDVSEWSEAIVYNRPEQELGTTVAYWDTQEAGVFHYNSVEGAGGYLKQYYYRADSESEWRSIGGTWSVSVGWKDTAGKDYTENCSSNISSTGAGQYYVTITALSGVLDEIANGVAGPMSPVLDTRINSDSLGEILDSASNPVEAVETLTEAADISSIQQAMQTSPEFLSKVEQLETEYAKATNVEVLPPAVSAEAQQYVKAEDVKVVGAAFNAAAGNDVKLDISMTAEAQKVPVYGFKNTVQMDLKLVSAGADVHELTMPVTVTMPVPAGIDARQLVLIHYLSNGGREEVALHHNGDGTVTFTVSSFSTFVFGEKEEQSGSGDEGWDNDCSSDEDGNVSGGYTADIESSIKDAAPNAVVTITDDSDKGITLSNGMMKELVKRGDVTLVLKYRYNGVDYQVTIPAGAAEDNDIEWYGPLYLAAHYGNGAGAAPVSAEGTYVVKSGDTLGKIALTNGMKLSEVLAKNPQITDANKIRVGQQIKLK